MRAVTYARTGDRDVLHLAELDRPQPRSGEVASALFVPG
jgi:NADPH:quinone reductase-like Zn-dependent oxidoreductase